MCHVSSGGHYAVPIFSSHDMSREKHHLSFLTDFIGPRFSRTDHYRRHHWKQPIGHVDGLPYGRNGGRNGAKVARDTRVIVA